MAANDGSIHINTKIDASGVNVGTKQISQTVQKNIARPMQGLTKTLSGILKNVVSIGKALAASAAAAVALAVVAAGKAVFDFVRNTLSEFDLLTGSSGDKFKALSEALGVLKGAFVNLIVQAFVPLIPYLIEFVNWLTVIFQTVTQVVAALFGFESTVGGIMTKAASGAKKAAKEAKGALAAFDQINVLQKPNAPEETATGPIATPESLKILDDILKKAEALREILRRLFEDPVGTIIKLLEFAWQQFIDWVRDNLPFGDTIASILTVIGSTLKKMFINFVETFLNVKKNILLVFQGIKEFITGVFTGDWALAWEGLKKIVTGVFGVMASIVLGILEHIGLSLGGLLQILQILFAPVIEFFGELFEKVKAKIGDAILSIMGAFGGLAKWFFENVWNPIEAGFGSAMTGIKQGFQQTFEGIKTLVKGIINTIIDYINGMIEGIVFGINTVIGSANAVAGLVGLPEIQSVNAPQIPRLATGAVIPPNSEFLAVLGDQRGGRNIEAPAAEFERMLERAVASGGGREIILRFTGTGADIARMLKPELDRENIRVGKSLATVSRIK